MKILFAGSESNESSSLMQRMGAKHLLLSYYYLRKKKDPTKVLDSLRKSASFMFLDSGAHTFFHEAGISVVHGEKKQKTEETPDQYIREYIEWLKQYGNYFDGYAELDIDQIVGHEKILEWHAMWKESKLPNVVYVYHPTQPISYWEKICAENKYVGIQGNLPLPRYNSYFSIAKRYKTKVHGFAMTKTDPMMKLPFFSVDSTSWQAGERFGMTYEFKVNKLLVHTKDEKQRVRRRLKPNIEKLGINYEAVMKDERSAVGEWNISQWIAFEEYIDKHSKKYWEDDTTANNVESRKSDGKKETKTSEPKKKPSSQALYIPEEYRGKIMKFRQDPNIEERRRVAAAYANRGNLHNFKHGKYASTNAFMTCANCYVSDKCPAYQEPTEENQKPVCAFSSMFNKVFKADSFDVRDQETVMESFNAVTSALLTRLSRALFFEEMDGGMLDKNVAVLFSTLIEMLNVNKPKEPQKGVYTQNNFYGLSESIAGMSEEQRSIIVEAIGKALALGGNTNADATATDALLG